MIEEIFSTLLALLLVMAVFSLLLSFYALLWVLLFIIILAALGKYLQHIFEKRNPWWK